ncbi:exocyst complex component 2-like isoform X1 [Octopus sinensis]|nr:exocyst complex component 2-like isoform X1 [Octopus sinensis]XP_036366932.1 exocyst complex component 2-like isoform X1 [Octopus sinensis]
MPIPPPLVTGVSPKEGPPGTRITIRGENLGHDAKDLVGLKICGVDCLLSAEWKTSSKIVARTGPGKGKGEIIVSTRTGGVGSCTVGFRGYFIQIGPLQESAIWIDESQTVLSNLGRGRASSPMLIKDNEDPLGLSDEGTQPKFKEDELLEMFPEASGKMSLENFSPAWYLLENHHSTSFDDLKAGLGYMKRKAAQRSEGPIAFMKSNLSSTIDCLSSLSAMNRMFATDDIRGDCMNSYAVLLMQAKSCADGLFQEVLGRKDKADSTRNALSVLHRFKFLFYLPLHIERNIQRGDYNLVINDFVRARSLFADTQVQIFKKVYKEVEEQINLFRKMLHNKLLELPNSLEEQKKLIRYLVSLESGGEPAWECLNNQQNWLMTMLSHCRNEHIIEGKKLKKEDCTIERKQTTPMSPHQTGYGRNKSSNLTSGQDQSTTTRFKTPQKVLFIEELNDIVTENFPDFWKLGHAYFAGSLIHKETGDKSFKIDSNKHLQFKQMVSDVITFFANLVRAAFLPESLENLPREEREKYGIWPENKQEIPFAWLPHCVRCVRSCVSSLTNLDLPTDSTDLIQELAFDMRTHCMFTLLKQAITDVECLHTKETWNVEADDEYGGTTQLPALFENIVNETIQHLHEVVIQNRTGEYEIFSQQTTQKEATMLCTKLLQAFSVCLHKLAFQQPQSIGDTNKSDSLQDDLPPFDKRLIIMLSNCNHVCNRVIPRLVENLEKHGYVEMDKGLQIAQAKYLELDNKLFEAYIEEKSNPIVGAMEQNMYRGSFDWNTCTKPVAVRSYLKEVLMGMIEVHAEVYAVFPSFVPRVMCKVVEAVAEELSRLMLCSTGFNSNGALQARLELIALQDAVSAYRNDAAIKHFQEALAILTPIGSSKKTEEILLTDFKSTMRFHLMCFYADSVVETPA